MRCSVNRLLQLATTPRLQPMRSDTSSHVWPSASSKINLARRASSARVVRPWARRVSSISSEFVKVIASLMDAIIVYKWLLQSTSFRGAGQVPAWIAGKRACLDIVDSIPKNPDWERTHPIQIEPEPLSVGQIGKPKDEALTCKRPREQRKRVILYGIINYR